MKKIFLIAATATAFGTLAAQNMTDAVRAGERDIIGTARFRSMAGAFGALGGDPSVMANNPAGLGIYRGTNSATLTPHLKFTSTESRGSDLYNLSENNFAVSNASVVLSFKLDNDYASYFNFGIGFNRSSEVRRRYQTSVDEPFTSFNMMLSEQANYSSTAPLAQLAISNKLLTKDGDGIYYDPLAEYMPWQSLSVREQNRHDEYMFSGAFNILDVFYVGATLSITDYNSIIESSFSEEYELEKSEPWIDYYNKLETKGTGFNAKFGILLKPSDQLRIGAAIHTPTWIRMKDFYWGSMDSDTNPNSYSHDTGNNVFEYSYRSPWEYQVSAAAVLGTAGLLSFEYDARDYSSMKYSTYNTDPSTLYDGVNKEMNLHGAMQHTFKAGLELRLTPRVSARFGYAYVTSPYDEATMTPDEPVNGEYLSSASCFDLYESNTKPNYSTLDRQNYITGGLGYRGQNWVIDFSCMSRTRRDYVYNYSDAFAVGDRVNMRTHSLDWDLSFTYKF